MLALFGADLLPGAAGDVGTAESGGRLEIRGITTDRTVCLSVEERSRLMVDSGRVNGVSIH